MYMAVCRKKNCSNINNDLYLNHLPVIDSPTCRCGFIIEDVDNFFFNCPNYTNERVTLFNEFRNYLPKYRKILFGNDSLTDQDYTSIFIAF